MALSPGLLFAQVTGRPCTTGGQNNSGHAVSVVDGLFPLNGSDTSATYRTFHRVVGENKNLVVWYGGWTCLAGRTGEMPLGNDYQIQACAEILYPDGTSMLRQVRFGGNKIGTVRDGANLHSDPISGDFPDGTIIWLRQRPSVPMPGMHWPSQGYWQTGLGEGVTAKNKVVGTGGGDFTTIGFPARFGPVCITGVPVHRNFAAPAILSDSYDGAAGGGVAEYGIVRRCLSNNIAGIWYPGDPLPSDPNAQGDSDAAFVRLERAGYGFDEFTGAKFANRLPFCFASDYLVVALGINDTRFGVATMKANLLAMMQPFAGTRIPVVIRTLGMRVTTSDNCTTAAGQTPTSSEESRVAYNDYLRDPLGAQVDIAAITGGSVKIWDAFASIEVNAANVPERNGGRWRIMGKIGPYTVKGGTSSTIDLAPFSIKSMGHREPNGPGTGFLLEQNQYAYLAGKLKYTSGPLAGQFRTFSIVRSETASSTIPIQGVLPQVPKQGDQLWIYLTCGSTGDDTVIHPSEVGMRQIYSSGRSILLAMPLRS